MGKKIHPQPFLIFLGAGKEKIGRKNSSAAIPDFSGGWERENRKKNSSAAIPDLFGGRGKSK